MDKKKIATEIVKIAKLLQATEELTFEEKLASKILKMAKQLISMEFNTDKELKKYLKDHPDANKSKHKVKKKDGPTIIKIDKPLKKRTPRVDKKYQVEMTKLIKKHDLKKDELEELAGFQKSLGRKMEGKRGVPKLKADFISNMGKTKGESSEAFSKRKDRMKKMSNKDFDRLLTILVSDTEDVEN